MSWNCYKDIKPESNLYVYVIDMSNLEDKVDIGKVCQYNWKDSYYWCYVYIPDVPKRKKLEACKELKGCSNDYILALEERIEILESLVRSLD